MCYCSASRGGYMARHRSPNCPQISFTEAIDKGRKVYENEHTHAAARLVVAQDLGYKGLSGPALGIIGALRQYGILEGSGDALHISSDALAYFEMDNGPEKQEAVQRMVFAPTLFAELKQVYGAKLPSEGNLRHTLIMKGFSSETAEDVIRVYKANVELVGGEETGYSDDDPKKGAAIMTEVVNSMFPAQKPNPTVQTYAFALSPDARAELSLRGTITPDDLELLRDHVELTIKALARKAKAEQ
jgi:hypothetical protein